MDGLLYGADAYVATWVNERCGSMKLPQGEYSAIGALDGNDLIAGILFFDQQDNDLLMALALDTAAMAKPWRIAEVMKYPFINLDMHRVSAEIAMSNKRCVKMALGMGFKQEGLKRQAADDGGDLGVFGLLREEFKLKDRLYG